MDPRLPLASLRLRIAAAALAAAIVSPGALTADAVFGDPSLYEVVIDPVTPRVDPFPLVLGHNVLTQRNNNQRTGASAWDGFNEATVQSGRFGLVKTIGVQGGILAQPLFMESVEIVLPLFTRSIPVVFVATAKNNVCAYDADPPFAELWCRHLADPFTKRNLHCAKDDKDCNAQMACPGQMTTTESDFLVVDYIGIESTPVIDPAQNLIFVSYRTADNMQRVAALDLSTGALRMQTGIEEGDRLWNKLHRQRASLLLAGDVLYVAFAGACEDPGGGFRGEYAGSYQGWVYAYDARTLRELGRYRTMQSPSGAYRTAAADPMAGGGIWQASTGLAADAHGNLFFSTGNATHAPSQIPPDPSWKNLSNSVVRLRATRDTSGTPGRPPLNLDVLDWFVPYRKVWQEIKDMDLGAAGVVLIPGTTYLVTGGKEGILYLLDANRMGGFDAHPPFDPKTVLADPAANHYETAKTRPDNPNRDHVTQKFKAGYNQYCEASKAPADLDRLGKLFCFEDGAKPSSAALASLAPSMDGWLPWPHIHGTPAFGSLGSGLTFLYIWPEKDHLKSFRWLGDRFETTGRVATGLPQAFPGATIPLAVLAPPLLAGVPFAPGMPGGMLSLNIDRSLPGHGILFASVQRCRNSKDDNVRYECGINVCETPPGCQEQQYGMLRAFDPVTLKELWNDQLDPQTSDADKNYWYAKWVPPTIAKGRVFHATGSDKLLVYGIR